LFKSKLLQIVLAMLIVITLILTAFFVLWNYMDKQQGADESDPKSSVESVQGKKLSATQIKDNTFIVKDVVTNLSEKDKIIKVSFAFQLDSKKAREEMEKIDFKVKSIIMLTLADMTREQVSGSKGQDTLTATLMNKINPILTEGKLKEISVTEFIVQ